MRYQALRRVAHDRHARRNVSDGRPEIYERLAFAGGVPGVHGRHADLHLKRRRHSIERFEPVVLGSLSVRIKIDKAGSDDESFGIDLDLPFKWRRRNRGDLRSLYGHIANSVELRGGIDDAPAMKNDVIALRQQP